MGVVKRWEGVLKILVTLAALAATAYTFSAYFVMTRKAHGETAAAQYDAHPHLAPAGHEHAALRQAVTDTGAAVRTLSGRVEVLEQTQRGSTAEVARYLHGMSCIVVDRGAIRPDGECTRPASLAPIRTPPTPPHSP